MPRKRPGGFAVLLVLAMLALGGTWIFLSQLNAASSSHEIAKRSRNAVVLSQAKEALVGHMAMQALKAGEEDPGRLPCPEPASVAGSALEGATAGACALAVGRFPWRTVGTPKLVDADGEPLWLVVSPGWAKASSSAYLTINSNSSGNLTVDGVANAAVALIIAPGPAMNVAAAAGCAARNQIAMRGAPSAAMDVRDYLECFDSATATYSTRGAASSFNDQVVAVTTADVMPALEAAIAKRIEREVVPVLRTVYADTTWAPELTTATPAYPYAAPFGDPTAANYQGNGSTRGLLPVNHQTNYVWNSGTSTFDAVACAPASEARCAPAAFLTWGTPSVTQIGGTGSIGGTPACGEWGSYSYCSGSYSGGTVQLRYHNVVANVANAMRVRGTNPSIGTMDVYVYNPVTSSLTVVASGITPAAAPAPNDFRLASDGFRVGSQVPTLPAQPGPRNYYVFTSSRSLGTFPDHPLLDTRPQAYTTVATGWFMRNEWYRLTYYAIAPGHTTATLPGTPACTAGGTCLAVTNVAPTAAQRAILILAGRSINGSARPSAALADYLEFGNATAAFEKQPVKKALAVDVATKSPFNDQIIVVESN